MCKLYISKELIDIIEKYIRNNPCFYIYKFKTIEFFETHKIFTLDNLKNSTKRYLLEEIESSHLKMSINAFHLFLIWCEENKINFLDTNKIESKYQYYIQLFQFYIL